MIVDMAAPGQRLVSHPQAAFRGAFAQFVEILRRPIDPAQRLRVHGGTDQHQVGAQFLHHVELAFGPVESLGTGRFGQGFEIAEGLKQGDVEPVVADHVADIARAAVMGDEILFEDLDSVEPGGGDGLELFTQRAGNGNGGNRGFHLMLLGGGGPARHTSTRGADVACCAVSKWCFIRS